MTLPMMFPTPVSAQDAGVVVSARSVSAGFPRAARVRAKAEFSRVFDAGRRTAEPRLALHWLADGNPPRLGLAVSRKVDPNAVGRNRIKRVLRDSFRHLRADGLADGAYVVVARSGAARADNAALREAFVQLLQRAGALPRSRTAGTMPHAGSNPASSVTSSPTSPDDAAP